MSAGAAEGGLRGGLRDRMEDYVAALEAGDLEGVLELFRPKAKIVSPLEGTLDAKTFYTRLFEATEASRVQLLKVFIGDAGWSAAHLKYDWTLSDGTRTRFEVMDLFHFDDDGQIKELKIFYDPGRIRESYEGVRGQSKKKAK
jgi:hypothetical protein